MLNFFDIPVPALPQEADYYFNVLVIVIGIKPEEQEDFFGEDQVEAWYVEELTSPRPRAFYFYIEEEFEDDEVDYEVEFIPHQVVEIRKDNNEVSFYDMLDFDTDDNWRIDSDGAFEY